MSSPASTPRFPGSDLSYLLSFSPTSPIKALYCGESDSDADTVSSLEWVCLWQQQPQQSKADD